MTAPTTGRGTAMRSARSLRKSGLGQLVEKAHFIGAVERCKVARLTSVTLEPESYAFHHMLGSVSARAFDEGGPLLSAVVVHKDDGRPGGGFCELARGVGFEIADDGLAEDIFWGQQIEAVHAWWRRR